MAVAVFAPSALLRNANTSSQASAVLALIEEDDRSLQEFALKQLLTLVDTNWAQCAEAVSAIEALAEDEAFPSRALAALVASKIFYHLEAYSEAVRLALAAGPLLDINSKSEYVETMLARSIDEYISARIRAAAQAAGPGCVVGAGGSKAAEAASSASSKIPAAALEVIVNRMFSRCWADGSFKQALGVALESQRLDAVEETLKRAVASGAQVEGLSASSGLAARSGGAAASAVGAAAQQQQQAGGNKDFLQYAYEVASTSVVSRSFRRAVLQLLASLHSAQQEDSRDNAALARVQQSLDDSSSMAKLLAGLLLKGYQQARAVDLVPAAATAGAAAASSEGMAVEDAAAGATAVGESSSTETAPVAEEAAGGSVIVLGDSALLAFQLAFDALESQSQSFLVRLYSELEVLRDQQVTQLAAGSGSAAPAAGPGGLSLQRLYSQMRNILSGSLTMAAQLDFLSSNCRADPLLLKNIKAALDGRNSVLHHATLVAHGYMYCGTGIDSFLRNNLDWLGKATNWNKFSAAASQGLLHRGQLKDSGRLLQDYLPRLDQPTQSPYSEGGALMALGLIHANRGAGAAAGMPVESASSLAAQNADGSADATAAGGAAAAVAAGGEADAAADPIAYLRANLTGTQQEVLQHGACLGLGLAGMATGRDDLYSPMRDVLFQESAVASEGAALGMGLLLAGKGPSWVSESSGEAASTELLGHARDTQHDKTVRGIALGLALMSYGLEEGAEVLIAQLVKDKDALLRYGGAFAIGLAYVGSSNNAAVRQLLHMAVSDVSDDVRRAAVMAIGFVLCRTPEELPGMVGALAESYNPHVRYGAAMAVGIACAGTGLPAAVGLLEPLLGDSVDYVRQGALLACGLVLQQEGAAHLPKAQAIRERISSMPGDRMQTSMAKMGAILALGIMDAGGRNCVASMVSRGGTVKMAGAIGMALWLQYWYWYPLLHSISLAFQPTAFLGLTADMRLAESLQLHCACPPSWFAYVPALVEKKEDKSSKVTVVELSVTAKQKAKAKSKAAKEGGVGSLSASSSSASATGSAAAGTMEVEGITTAAVVDGGAAAAATGAEEGAKKEEGTEGIKKEEKEAAFHSLQNSCRVTLSQVKFLSIPDSLPAESAGGKASSQRYVPVAKDIWRRATGVVVLKDNKPQEGVDRQARAIREPTDDQVPEPAPFITFEWDGQYA